MRPEEFLRKLARSAKPSLPESPTEAPFGFADRVVAKLGREAEEPAGTKWRVSDWQRCCTAALPVAAALALLCLLAPKDEEEMPPTSDAELAQMLVRGQVEPR